MLHILMIPVRQIIHAFASTIIVKYQKQSPRGVLFYSDYFWNTDVQQDTFQKSRKFGYYFRFPSFCFLEEKPLDFTCAS